MSATKEFHIPNESSFLELFKCAIIIVVRQLLQDILAFSVEFSLLYDVINHVQSKNNSRWPISEYRSLPIRMKESEEKTEIRQFVSFLQVFPCLYKFS